MWSMTSVPNLKSKYLGFSVHRELFRVTSITKTPQKEIFRLSWTSFALGSSHTWEMYMKDPFQEALPSRCICLSLQKQEYQTLEYLADIASLSCGVFPMEPPNSWEPWARYGQHFGRRIPRISSLDHIVTLLPLHDGCGCLGTATNFRSSFSLLDPNGYELDKDATSSLRPWSKETMPVLSLMNVLCLNYYH